MSCLSPGGEGGTEGGRSVASLFFFSPTRSTGRVTDDGDLDEDPELRLLDRHSVHNSP